MKSVKMNQNRTFWTTASIVVRDEEGKEETGTFKAKFKVITLDESRTGRQQMNQALVEIKYLELVDDEDNVLKGDDLLTAAKADPEIFMALHRCYNEEIGKKPQ